MIPTQTFSWPNSNDALTQIQQLKAAGVTGNPPSANPQTKSPTTQGVPKVVTNLGVTRRVLSSTEVQLSVSFTHNAGDPYFSTAKVYLKSGNNAATLVSEGEKSPIVFSATRTNTSTTLVVVSSGNWGSTPIAQSPAKTVSLA